jgi:hypothetical protein
VSLSWSETSGTLTYSAANFNLVINRLVVDFALDVPTAGRQLPRNSIVAILYVTGRRFENYFQFSHFCDHGIAPWKLWIVVLLQIVSPGSVDTGGFTVKSVGNRIG